MSTPLTTLERMRALSAERASVRGSSRLVGCIFTLVIPFTGLVAVPFVIGRKIPIDPVLAILGDRASAAAYAAARLQLGLDKPLTVQFLIYVRDVLHGNFGMSLLTAHPVIEDILRVFPATLELATLATIIGVLIGVPLGVIAAVRHNRWIDHVARFIGLVGSSGPVFWLGLMG